MKYIDADKLKGEIERRIELHDSLASNAESEMIANLEIGAAQALDDLRSFLSTLESEKPMQEGLEEELERCVFEPYYDLDGVAVKGATAYITVNDVADIARHFAEWGAEHLKK